MVGTFLPMKHYLAPVLVIHAGVQGLTYYHACERDLSLYEVIATITTNCMQSACSAYIIQYAVNESFKLKDESEIIVRVFKK